MHFDFFTSQSRFEQKLPKEHIWIEKQMHEQKKLNKQIWINIDMHGQNSKDAKMGKYET